MTCLNQKPFLKWVGGKTQLLSNIINLIPNDMLNYHEPFLGGGSVLLAVLMLNKNKKINIRNKVYAYDINQGLINLYRQIQSNPNQLFEKINNYMDEYKKINQNIINRNPESLDEAKTSQESYYYWLRKLFNQNSKDSIDSAALFIIINKLCFRGMYREGPNGYNVPFGHYKKVPTIISKDEIIQISELIKDVNFICTDFETSLHNISEDDFIYVDPPYAPENSKSFVGYNVEGFTINKHNKLFEILKSFNNSKFMMSNSNVDFVLEKFNNYNITTVSARRAINSKNPGSTTTEVLICNY